MQKLPFKYHWAAKISIENEHQGIFYFQCGKHSRSFFRKIHLENLARGPILVAKSFIRTHSAPKLSWNWSEAILLYAMAKYSDDRLSMWQQELTQYLKQYHQYYLQNPPKIDWADRCPSALSGLLLAKQTGDRTGLANAHRVADFLHNSKRNAFGSLNHFGNDTFMARLFPASIWVDSLMMWALFAVQYGKDMNDQSLFDFGLEQMEIFYKYLYSKQTGLFYHAWNVDKNTPYPKNNTFWLRGNGWVIAALIDMLDQLPPSDARYKPLAQKFQGLAHATLKYRLDNFLWDTLISMPGKGYSESSGSALIAYAYAKGARLKLLPAEFKHRALETYNALNARLINEKDKSSLPEISWLTMPYGPLVYKIIPRKKNMPYGIGAYLLLAREFEL